MRGPGLPGGVGGAPQILIVDDDATLRSMLIEQLEADGFHVSTAASGEDALRRLNHGWPDLVLLDMMMPGMDGFALAREIKARADLPIIVLSAIDAGDSKADMLDEVAEDYITKPYHYPELRARINRVLRRLGDRVPRQRLEARARSRPGAPPAPGNLSGKNRRVDADRIPPPLHPRGESGTNGDDRDPPLPRVGRDGRRRTVICLGDDAPPPAEDRAGPEPPQPPVDHSWDRIPACRRRRTARGPRLM